ncbi:hypothetical protein C942_02252 [Photobacterium marinum]|uniref:Uncharacterized protein n=2 Tax=Photobacterium marinum TaxID=1056511 RepID=L8J7B8_9GAMM|nr:hypothetical protein C942_02252 [Photobacterium marinum]
MVIAEWALEGDWYHCDELWRQLWSEVEFLDFVRDSMVEPGRTVKHEFSMSGIY